MFPKFIYEKLCDIIEYTHLKHSALWLLIDRFNEKIEREVQPQFLSVPQDVSVQPIILDYLNRKHIFAYNGTSTAIIMTSDDGNAWGTSLPATSWTNISYPPGTRLLATTHATIRIKCTDELIP